MNDRSYRSVLLALVVVLTLSAPIAAKKHKKKHKESDEPTPTATAPTASAPVAAKTPSATKPAATKTVPAPSAQPVGAQQGAIYPTVEMHHSQASDRSSGVVYLNAVQREQRRVVIRNGLVYDRAGTQLVSTTGKHHNENNYVMDAAGNFYLFDEFTTPSIRHSSIFAGAPVAGAGNILILDGHVTYIDSDSGHYPSTKVFGNVIKELAARGVDTSGISDKKR